MLANQSIISKKPNFAKFGKSTFLLQNGLLSHRVFFDFKTDTLDYRLRLLPRLNETIETHSVYLQIKFIFQGQAGIALCETSLITALLDLEATDFDINKLTATEQNAAFKVVQQMIQENGSRLAGLVIQQMQLIPVKNLPDISVQTMPIQLSIKVTSVEHLSYIHLYLSPKYNALLDSAIQQAPLIPNDHNHLNIVFKQDLELRGCQLNQQEVTELDIGDVVLFDQSQTDYHICIADQYRFSLSAGKQGLSLLSELDSTHPLADNFFDFSVKLHQALVKNIEDDDILQAAQQQIEHSQQQPLKTLYCNDTPFALVENISIAERLGMRIIRFL